MRHAVWLTPDAERRLDLRGRLAGWERAGLLAPPERDAALGGIDDDTRRFGLLPQIILFMLASWAMSAVLALCVLFGIPQSLAGLAVGLLGAELLIAQFRFMRTGVEDALYVGGIVIFISGLPGSPGPETSLVFGVAFLLVGLRLWRGLWLAVGLFLLALWIPLKVAEAPGAFTDFSSAFVPVMLALAALAAAVGQRMLRRPAMESASAILVVLLPPIALLVWLFDTEVYLTSIQLLIGWTLVLGLLLLFLWGRWKPALWSAGLTAGMMLVDLVQRLWNRFAIDQEWSLIGLGALLVASARLLQRRLAGRTSGLTSDPLEQSEIDSVEPLGAAGMGASTAPHHEAAAADGPALEDATSPTDSSFGGGGSTEKW